MPWKSPTHRKDEGDEKAPQVTVVDTLPVEGVISQVAQLVDVRRQAQELHRQREGGPKHGTRAEEVVCRKGIKGRALGMSLKKPNWLMCGVRPRNCRDRRVYGLQYTPYSHIHTPHSPSPLPPLPTCTSSRPSEEVAVRVHEGDSLTGQGGRMPGGHVLTWL